MIVLNVRGLCLYFLAASSMLQVNEVPAVGRPAFDIETKLTSGYLYDSNIYRTPSGKTADNLIEIRPDIRFAAHNNIGSVNTRYDGTYTRYFNNDLADFVNSFFKVNVDTNQKKMFSFDAEYVYMTQNESRGNQEISDDITSITFASLAESLNYGMNIQNSRRDIRLESSVLTTTRRYKNSRLKRLDSDYQSLNLKLIYKFTSATNAYIAGEKIEYEYVASLSPNAKNLEDKYYVGSSWKVTGKSSAIVELGLQSKKLNASPNKTNTSLYTRMLMEWNKSSKSNFTFIVMREASDNPYGDGRYEVVNSVEIDWAQVFTRKLSTKLITKNSIIRAEKGSSKTGFLFELSPSVTYKVTRKTNFSSVVIYRNRNSIEAKSNFYQFYLSARHRVRRKFEVFATYIFERRTSEIEFRNYFLNITSVGLKVRF